MYITAASSRMECTEVRSVYQFDNLSFDGSHESFDTIDNEGYSTDTSFIDQVMLDFVGIQAHMLYLMQELPKSIPETQTSATQE